MFFQLDSIGLLKFKIVTPTWTQVITSNNTPNMKEIDTIVSIERCGPRFYKRKHIVSIKPEQ